MQSGTKPEQARRMPVPRDCVLRRDAREGGAAEPGRGSRKRVRMHTRGAGMHPDFPHPDGGFIHIVHHVIHNSLLFGPLPLCITRPRRWTCRAKNCIILHTPFFAKSGGGWRGGAGAPAGQCARGGARVQIEIPRHAAGRKSFALPARRGGDGAAPCPCLRAVCHVPPPRTSAARLPVAPRCPRSLRLCLCSKRAPHMPACARRPAG